MKSQTNLKAPFSWFGGKSSVTHEVWKRFGTVPNYIEPFFGSGAMLLGRPAKFSGSETVNDKDGLIANFWRAVQADPDEVARWADSPVNENDLHAVHYWLVERKNALVPKLEGDPGFFDAKIAGRWVWGICCWIGSGWCSGDGPWSVQETNGDRQLVHLSDAGHGVNRQRVHIGDAGQGGIQIWMRQLSERLKRVRVCSGDWRRVAGGKSGDSLKHFFASGNRCAVFLDPPYSLEAGRNMTLYREECGDVAHDVREWAISQGDDSRLRIALCGYEGEHDMPQNWTVFRWKAQGGYASISNEETDGKRNRHREVIYFSPHCLSPEKGLLW